MEAPVTRPADPYPTSYPKSRVKPTLTIDTTEVLVAESPTSDAVKGSLRCLTINPQSAAYMIFTSGSTGVPKGVVVTHSNLRGIVAATTLEVEAEATDVWAMCHSSAFDVSVVEMWLPLTTGGVVAVFSPMAVRDPARLTGLIEEHGVTVLSQTPTAFAAISRSDSFQTSLETTSLRAVIFAGEALFRSIIDPVLAFEGTKPRLYNMYGITETTVHVTSVELSGDAAGDPAPMPLGPALPGYERCLYWNGRDRVPNGFVGEICVSGAGVSRGYFADPRRTASRFVPDPNSDPGSRMYRSGDLARISRQNQLVYIGRSDNQVKVRGYRIEVGDIEAAARRVPGITEVACVVEQLNDSPSLIGYFIESEANEVGIERIWSELSAQLPTYMVPARFRTLATMPLTRNGKLDRARLPFADWQPLDIAVGVEATTELEKAIAGVWCRELDLEAVPIDLSFFALGGDSLSAISIVDELHSRDIFVTTEDLLTKRTVRELAKAVRSDADGMKPAISTPAFSLLSDSDRSDIARTLGLAVEDAFPVSALQLAMMFHMRSSGQRHDYHNVTAFSLNWSAEPCRFAAAVRVVTQKYAALRTSFDLTTYAEPVQLVWKHVEPIVTISTATTAPEGSSTPPEVATIMRREELNRFDPGTAPLLRWNVVLVDEVSSVLVLTEFHPIIDGWSLHTVLRDVFAEYHNPGSVHVSAGSSYGMSSHVALERSQREQGSSLAYWKPRIAQAAMTRVSKRQAGLAERRTIGDRTNISDEKWNRLLDLAADLDVRPSAVCLAVHLSVLGALTQQDATTTGVVAHTRPENAGAADAVGLFLNTLPVSVELQGRTWAEVIRSVDTELTQSWPHRFVPLVDIKALGSQELPFDSTVNFVDFRVLTDYVKDTDGVEVAGVNRLFGYEVG